VEQQVADMDPRPELHSLVVPLGGGRYRIEITIDEATYGDLCRLQQLMRHEIPDGDPARIIARAVSRHREHVEHRKFADLRGPPVSRVKALRSRYIPAAVRRAVLERDGGQCAFVGTRGRCQEQGFLELHHVVPFAKGGTTTIDNLQLRCRAHNQYEADQAGLGRKEEVTAPAVASDSTSTRS
jgi:5-methylcytosine-specific restriction endonuclease McrA